MIGDLDTWLSLVDIAICVLDIALVSYLFFVRLPYEHRKAARRFRSRIMRRRRRDGGRA